MLYSFQERQLSSKHLRTHRALCQFCQRSLSRRYNRDRHEKQGCPKRLEQQQVEKTNQYAMNEGSPATVAQGNDDEEYENNLRQEDEQDEE